MSQRNYQGAIVTLNSLQTARSGHASTLPKYNKLESMTKYLHKCNIPLEKLDSLSIIHVTGTHGKGSTCFYCENVLLKHGYKPGFYSSPHLLEVRERIRIDGLPITKDIFSEYFWEVYDMLDKQKENDFDMPLYFPFLTILAFYIFLKSNVEVAIIEVGIGGEYDCTNVIRNPVAVGITPISVDHTPQLGITEESIAWHKGGIMKPGSIAFSVSQPENILNVLKDRSNEKNCPLVVLQESLFPTDVASTIPVHIRKTAATLAIALSQAFINKKRSKGSQIDDRTFSLQNAIRSIENSSWPGRYDIRKRNGINFFLDGAHTQNSIRTAAEWFKHQTALSDNQKVLIFNLTGKRDPQIFLQELVTCEFDLAIFMPNVGHEKETADVTNFKLTTDDQLSLCEVYSENWCKLQTSQMDTKLTKVFPSFVRALRFLDDSNQPYDVLITGSLYLVGAALSVIDPTLNGSLII